MTKKSFEKLDTNLVSLVQDNVAWGVATRVSNHIVQAARISFDAGADLLTEDIDNLSPYKKGDQAYTLLQKAVDLVDAAELDGISSNVIETQLEEQMAKQWILDPRRSRQYDFEQQAFDSLFTSNDEFALMGADQQKPLVAELNAKLKKQAIQRDIAIRDAKLEYQDIALAMLGNLLNPAGNMVVTGTGNYDEYVESRGMAINARIKGFRGRSANVDGSWLNRYDFNGDAVDAEASTMDGYIIQLIDEGARLGYSVPEYPKTQEQAVTAFAAFKSAS